MLEEENTSGDSSGKNTFKLNIARRMKLKFCEESKIVWALEWILYIGLSVAAGWFASGVIDHFTTRKTSFSHNSEADRRRQIIILH